LAPPLPVRARGSLDTEGVDLASAIAALATCATGGFVASNPSDHDVSILIGIG